MSIQICRDISDAVALYLPQRLYLKSFAKLNISVQLPAPKVHGKSLSNWELMEKLRKLIQPDGFSLLKVTKHSSEVIRFDAELENRQKLERVLSRLEDRIVQLNDYPDPLKVKVSEAKSDFPNRHSWDSFFRDASDMDEMKPGERPDTIHIKNLPIRWFVHEKDRDEDATPSESLFKKVFEKYGSIRQVDVPVADPFRMQMKAQMRGITTPPQESELYFEGYLQYAEYASFIRCMDALRGCKLLRKNEDISEWCNIYVEFDKTKHMTDASVKRRAIVRERLTMRQKAKDVEERKEKEKLAKREAKERQKMENLEQEKVAKMREREERRKKKQLAKLMGRDDVDLNKRIAEEKKKLLKTQKRLQAVRLIEELFQRLELRPELHNRHNPQRYYNVSERTRQQAVTNIKRLSEKAVEEQREHLQQALDGRIIIRSALETKKPKQDSSISSISDEEQSHGHKRVKAERISPERDLYGKPGVYAYPNPYFGYPVSVPPYHYPQSMSSLYYPWRPDARRRGRGRGRARGRMPYFDGPDANRQYYQYFKKLSEFEHRNDHDNRTRSRSRSRSRSRRRSYSRSRSRSRSRRRSYTRSRSRSRRRSRSRSRRSRSRSRRSRSRSHRQGSSNRRSRSHSRSNSKSRRRSKSKSRRSKSRSKRTPTPKQIETTNGSRPRSKSWSLPKETRKSWSKTPEKLLQ